jgi:hypothetical protein
LGELFHEGGLFGGVAFLADLLEELAFGRFGIDGELVALGAQRERREKDGE